MATSEPKIVLQRIYEAFNRRNLNALDELLAASFIDHTAGSDQIPGREGIKQVWTQIWSRYPSIQLTTEDMFGEGDKVVARVNLESAATSGTQTIGRAIEVFRVVDGRAVELWNLIRFY